MLKALKNTITQFFPGRKEIRNRKIGIFSFLFSVSIIGIISHGFHLSKEGNLFHLYEEFSIHILAGLVLFVFIDYTFHNISKWYGMEKEFNYTILIDRIKGIEKSEKKEVLMMNTFLMLFTSPSWKEEVKRFKEEALIAIGKGIQFKVLMLDPITFSARHRMEEIKDAKNNSINVIDEIFKTIKGLYEIQEDIQEDKKDHFEVKIFNRIPPFALFKTGDFYSLNFFPASELSYKTDHWTFFEDGPLSEFILKKFYDIWEDHTNKGGNIKNTCNIYEFMFVTILGKDTEEKLHFVDLYNKESGYMPERKIIILYIEKEGLNRYPISSNLRLIHRGKKVEGEVIDFNALKSSISGNIKFKNEAIDEVSNELLKMKYPKSTCFELLNKCKVIVRLKL
jgi:hypothetical protein